MVAGQQTSPLAQGVTVQSSPNPPLEVPVPFDVPPLSSVPPLPDDPVPLELPAGIDAPLLLDEPLLLADDVDPLLEAEVDPRSLDVASPPPSTSGVPSSVAPPHAAIAAAAPSHAKAWNRDVMSKPIQFTPRTTARGNRDGGERLRAKVAPPCVSATRPRGSAAPPYASVVRLRREPARTSWSGSRLERSGVSPDESASPTKRERGTLCSSAARTRLGGWSLRVRVAPPKASGPGSCTSGPRSRRSRVALGRSDGRTRDGGAWLGGRDATLGMSGGPLGRSGTRLGGGR